MGELQWALLIVCVGLVVALYVFSQRGKSGSKEGESDDERSLREASADQSDLFAPPKDYDEYGVGRKRKRGDGEPSVGAPAVREPPAPSMATLLNPLPGQAPAARSTPVVVPPVVGGPVTAAPPAAAPTASPTATRTIVLMVAPTEETDILGPQLHAALAAEGLKFGEGDVYHRIIGGRSVYSVASLLKPGKLIPAEAENFSTKGLAVMLTLPGPVTSSVAFDDMLSTTRALATALKLDIFDTERERLTDESGRKLRADVEGWARSNKLS